MIGVATRHNSGVIRSKTSEKEAEWQKLGDMTRGNARNFNLGAKAHEVWGSLPLTGVQG